MWSRRPCSHRSNFTNLLSHHHPGAERTPPPRLPVERMAESALPQVPSNPLRFQCGEPQTQVATSLPRQRRAVTLAFQPKRSRSVAAAFLPLGLRDFQSRLRRTPIPKRRAPLRSAPARASPASVQVQRMHVAGSLRDGQRCPMPRILYVRHPHRGSLHARTRVTAGNLHGLHSSRSRTLALRALDLAVSRSNFATGTLSGGDERPQSQRGPARPLHLGRGSSHRSSCPASAVPGL